MSKTVFYAAILASNGALADVSGPDVGTCENDQSAAAPPLPGKNSYHCTFVSESESLPILCEHALFGEAKGSRSAAPLVIAEPFLGCTPLANALDIQDRIGEHKQNIFSL
jgi:hypothetical protein